MKIGIIGAGAIGGTLARQLVKLGHEVRVANSRGPETLKALAAESGAIPVSVREAARSGSVVVLTIPFKVIPDLPPDLFDGVSSDVVVFDTNNYYPRLRDGRIDAIEDGTLESRWVAERIGRPVVKVFNNILATSLRDKGAPPRAPGRRVALPVAGEPVEGRRVALRLLDELGFDGVDVGPLEESWRQQPGTPAYCRDLDAASLTRALSEAARDRLAEYRYEAEEDAKRRLGV